MNSTFSVDDLDLNRIVVGPLYLGMVTNILIPMALLMICYYINNNYGVTDNLEDTAQSVFILFCALAIAEGGFAIWYRSKLFGQPMIRRRETFEEDFTESYKARCRPLFLLIASMSIYGYLFFFLTGRFNEAVLFVVFSFLVFQIVRPRHGLVRKLAERQMAMVEQGRLMTPQQIT